MRLSRVFRHSAATNDVQEASKQASVHRGHGRTSAGTAEGSQVYMTGFESSLLPDLMNLSMPNTSAVKFWRAHGPVGGCS